MCVLCEVVVQGKQTRLCASEPESRGLFCVSGCSKQRKVKWKKGLAVVLCALAAKKTTTGKKNHKKLPTLALLQLPQKKSAEGQSTASLYTTV